tara:strand:- start:871 stop:1116 length:246 start_codon:yes stop_codon:yes gene_type:complete
MAYDLSELKHDLTVLLENCERLIEYEQNNDIGEEIRSRVYDAIKDAQDQALLLDDEINDGIYDRDDELYTLDDEGEIYEED